MSEAQTEFVPVPMGGDPQGQVDIDRYFTDHAAQLESHDWGESEPPPALAKLAQQFGIPHEDTIQRVPLPWTQQRREQHTQRGQQVRDYAASHGWELIAGDADHLTSLAGELVEQQQRLQARYEALPAMDRDGDLGGAGDYEWEPYAQELDEIIAEHQAWRQRVQALAQDVQTVAGWLDRDGDDAGYHRARQLFRDQPAVARKIGALLSSPEAKIPEHEKRSRADVALPNIDDLTSAMEKLLRLKNRRNSTRLTLKAIHDAITSGKPLPKWAEATFRAAGKVPR